KLRPVNFRYTPEYRAMEGGLADKSYAGFIAQEYADVFPSDVISTSKHVPGADKNDPTILALDPNPALITAVAAVQELATENADLHHQIDELAARLSKLESRRGN
ncbi:MAG TPA: tail fiber domain-containing protein, partial [Rudaea sp.]|nr:tail fiber domain-containing protein [Rudaea sp.]